MPVINGFQKGIDSVSHTVNGLGPELSTSAKPGNEHVLELRNVSYIRTFTAGRWYARLFNPPVTAQFLKDVNMRVRGREIMGVVGANGCGKTTLLNVIARRVQGTMGGSITLDHRPMTERTFQNCCAYVSFKQRLMQSFTVEATLNVQADLCLPSSLSKAEKSNRVMQVIRDFELMDESDQKIGDLLESVRRRVLVALYALRDPVLILIDEPSRGIDPLSAYQLISAFSQYIRKSNKIGIITTSSPRSDIYPLLDCLTILFFGEVIYSGYTKMMPHYFRNVGFPCPASENPPIYFLSLATVDRETTERYLETQEQAVKLIETFKSEGQQFVRYPDQQTDFFHVDPFLPTIRPERPNSFMKLYALTKRNLAFFWSNWRLLLARLFSIPLFAILLFTFYFRIYPSPTSPQSTGGLCFNCVTSFSMITAAVTAYSFGQLRTRFYQDSWDNLYGGVLFIVSYLITPIILDVFAIFSGTAIVYWGCKLSSSFTNYVLFSTVLWCCCQFAQLHVVCLMLFVKSSYKAASITVVLLAICATAAAGFLKSLSTYPNSASDWLHYVTHASIFRYAGAFLQHQQLSNYTSGCTLANSRRRNAVCRWESGDDYLAEIYRQNDMENPGVNFGVCFLYVAALTSITIVLYSLPMPHFIKRKFRYK